MLSVLNRSDLVSVFKIICDDNPWEAAEELSRGHIFECKVVVVMHGDEDKLVAALSQCHIAENWHECSLQYIMGVWAMLYDQELVETSSSEISAPLPADPLPADPLPDPLPDDALPSCLLHCETSIAPSATTVRKDLIKFLGKEAAQTVVKQLKTKTVRQETGTTGTTGTVRAYAFNGKPVALKAAVGGASTTMHS